MDPPQNWISAQGCFWENWNGALGGVDRNGTSMAANPDLSYPPDVKTFDSEWIGCSEAVYAYAFKDPPTVLTPVSALVTVSTLSSTTSTPTTDTASALEKVLTDPLPGDVATFLPAVETSRPPEAGVLDPPWNSNSAPHPSLNSLPNVPSAINPPSTADATSLSRLRPDSTISPKSTSVQDAILLPHSWSQPGIISMSDPGSRADSISTPKLTPLLEASSHNLGWPPYVNPTSSSGSLQSALSSSHDPSGGKLTIGSPGTKGITDISLGRTVSQGAFSVVAEDIRSIQTLSNKVVPAQGAPKGSGDPTVVDQGTMTPTNFPMHKIGGPIFRTSTASRDPVLPASGSQNVVETSPGTVTFGGQTISYEQDIAIDGYTVSHGQGRVVTWSTTLEDPTYRGSDATTAQDPLPSMFGGKRLKLDGSGALLLDGETMSSGQRTTLGGQQMIIGASQVVIDATIYRIPSSSQLVSAKSTDESDSATGKETISSSNRKDALDRSTTDAGGPIRAQTTNRSASQTPDTLPSDTLDESGVARVETDTRIAASLSQATSTFARKPIADEENRPNNAVNAPEISRTTHEPVTSGGRPEEVMSIPAVTMGSPEASASVSASALREVESGNPNGSQTGITFAPSARTSSTVEASPADTFDDADKGTMGTIHSTENTVEDESSGPFAGATDEFDISQTRTRDQLDNSRDKSGSMTAEGKARTAHSNQPTPSSVRVQKDSNNVAGIGAVIMSALGFVPSKPSKAPPAAGPGSPSALPTFSSYTVEPSSDVGKIAPERHWPMLAMVLLGAIPYLL
ncbi:MAG: hypothetical protein Q9221_000959 [Calogaya cf. arnoldii]